MGRTALRGFAPLVIGCLGLLASSGVGAQGRPGSETVTLRELALSWARGRYRSPLICTRDGLPTRGLRRILIAPKHHRSVPVDRVSFFDLDLPPETICSTTLSPNAPNVIGAVLLSLPGKHRPDLATRDFRELLRREGGIRYEIPLGRLRIGPVGKPGDELEEVDFAGGKARLSMVRPGSDAWRVLKDFGDRRRLLLALESRNGRRLELPLVQFDLR